MNRCAYCENQVDNDDALLCNNCWELSWRISTNKILAQTMLENLSPQTIQVVAIEHKHGLDISMHYTEENARNKIAVYVKKNWNDELIEKHGEYQKLDTEDAIEKYFDFCQAHEWLDHDIQTIE